MELVTVNAERMNLFLERVNATVEQISVNGKQIIGLFENTIGFTFDVAIKINVHFVVIQFGNTNVNKILEVPIVVFLKKQKLK